MGTVLVDLLIAEGTTQARAYDGKLAEQYAGAMKDGAVFPPIVAFEDAKGVYLADGFHRRGAAQLAGISELAADIRAPIQGETAQRSAILFAVGANDAHGKNRSNEDKRHAVQMLLRDPEWSKWTNREIARQCRVDHKFVQTQRDKLINSGALQDSPTRTAKRNGKTYEVDTSNIGAKTDKPKLTQEQKKVAAQVRESEKTKPKAKDKAAWTKADDDAATAIIDAAAELEEAWNKATRPAQIHCLSHVKDMLKGFV